MKMKRAVILILILSLAFPAYAAITISTDNRSLFFGPMRLDEEKELTQFGSYHNEITCSSTSGNTWYLKISLQRPLTSGGGKPVPLENFKWQLVWTNGKGIIANPYQFKAFGLFPDLVYTSGSGEAGGSSLKFQFKYSLKIPEIQSRGVYNTTIRFTLTEAL